jgi:hypothetical protein
MKIANVIYEAELVNHTKAEYINYYNEPKVYNDLDKSLPTLYVGWSFMKACNPDDDIIQNADILKKKIITNELYWEFSFRESKPSHVKGVDKFAGLAPQFYFSPKYIYTNLDPVFFQLKDVEDLMDVCPKKIDTSYNYKNEMFYILKDNKIWGIDLRMYQFFQFNLEEILEKIGTRTTTLFTDLQGETYQTYYKIFPNFELLKRYIVAILSK